MNTHKQDAAGHIAAQQHADELTTITRRAEAIIAAYPATSDSLTTTITDVIADMLVLAQCRDLDPYHLVDRATSYLDL